MVQVTFNEKVECHQYNSATTLARNTRATNRNNRSEEIAPSSGRRHARLHYTPTFMKALRSNPESQICPDVVKKGIEDGKIWADKTISVGKSVFDTKPPNTYNYRRTLMPFYNNNNQSNFVINNHDVPIEPIGRRLVNNQLRNSRVSDFEYNFQNRNAMPDFGQPFNVRGKNTEEEMIPEWYDAVTSPNDRMDLGSFDGLGEYNESDKNNQLGGVDGNTSGGANSGASSSNSSPPAKSTPAKVNPTPMKNDSQRNRTPLGRSNIWQNNFDNRQNVGAPFLNEFFKNFSTTENKSNLRGLTPLRVEDVESTLLFERMKFRHMITQMQAQQRYVQEQVPSAQQILVEIDKIIRTSTEPAYKRQEVRVIIKNILESVIPPINLLNLLKNPLTEKHNRDAIIAAMNLYTLAKQNALTAMKAHTPTKAELRAHMDAILQDAIIKKRLETLNNELLKMGSRNFPNHAQTFHQMFPPTSVGRFPNYSQSDFRGLNQPVENVPAAARDNNLNRWIPSQLLNKGLSGELPQIPVADALRLEQLENTIKQSLKDNEKETK